MLFGLVGDVADGFGTIGSVGNDGSNLAWEMAERFVWNTGSAPKRGKEKPCAGQVQLLGVTRNILRPDEGYPGGYSGGLSGKRS